MCSEQKNFKEPTVIESTGIDILLDEESCDLRFVSLVAAVFGVGVGVSVVWLLFVLPTLTPTPTQPHIVARF
ncbi:unnamed protein product [Brassica oleracea var. botrytis]|uniref:Uncharacterized protein n=1 Tax=Brassica oleracea TaxID=3712 RepID=A0A3P6GAR6_BRAOL|nr:unnamed protein product [Brassica oleracea]